jgi:hypothetical protein
MTDQTQSDMVIALIRDFYNRRAQDYGGPRGWHHVQMERMVRFVRAIREAQVIEILKSAPASAPFFVHMWERGEGEKG